MKYAKAIAPEHNNAAGLVNRPRRASPPATSSITPAHQRGHDPTGAVVPYRSIPPNAPKRINAPWQRNRNDTTIRTTDSAAPLNRPLEFLAWVMVKLWWVVVVALDVPVIAVFFLGFWEMVGGSVKAAP